MSWWDLLDDVVTLEQVELRALTAIHTSQEWRTVDPDVPDAASLTGAAIEQLSSAGSDEHLRARIVERLAGLYGWRAACAFNAVQILDVHAGADLRAFLGQDAAERICAVLRTEAAQILAEELCAGAGNTAGVSAETGSEGEHSEPAAATA